MSQTTQATTAEEARENRVPPALRRWARDGGATDIRRYRSANETVCRGVVVEFDGDGAVLLKTRDLPAEWSVERVTACGTGNVRVQLTEDA